MKEGISVLSTHAQDILVREDGEVIAKQPGGPILFLEAALKKSGIPYQLFHGETLDVEILMTDHGEFGRVPVKPSTQPFPEVVSDWVVVSTLLQEWDLKNVKDFTGKVFVDLQGFVRRGDDFGKKRVWEEVREFAESVFCMKGTREEVGFLPDEVRDHQKNRLLIITDGDKGLEIFFQGKGFYLPTETPLRPKDTIGAGDTFFGWFVASMYKGEDVPDAARIAMRRTAEFLNEK